jgi:hypothetical protein
MYVKRIKQQDASAIGAVRCDRIGVCRAGERLQRRSEAKGFSAAAFPDFEDDKIVVGVEANLLWSATVNRAAQQNAVTTSPPEPDLSADVWLAINSNGHRFSSFG